MVKTLLDNQTSGMDTLASENKLELFVVVVETVEVTPKLPVVVVVDDISSTSISRPKVAR